MSSIMKTPDGWIATNIGMVAKTNLKSIDRNYPYQDIFYLDTGSITKGEIYSLQNYKLEDAPSRAKRLVKNNDILYSTVRPNQEHYGYVSNPLDNLIVSTGFAVITAESINSKFLYYYLIQASVTNFLHTLAEHSTSAYPSIKPIDIENIDFNIPIKIEEQKAIADILTAFDDKTELLKAQNKTLEETSQTIYKEWFGKYQKGDELPVGWETGTLVDIADHIKDNIKPFNNPNIEYYHFSLPAYDNGLSPVVEKGESIKSIKYSVKNRSFLVSKLNPFTPRIWTILNSEGNYICSTEFQVVKPKEEIYFTLIHCFLNSNNFTKELSQKIKGTSSSHQRVNPQDIFDVTLIIPNEADIKKLDELLWPIILKKGINLDQIQTLKQTRDTLLPKLMSGEVRVREFKD